MPPLTLNVSKGLACSGGGQRGGRTCSPSHSAVFCDVMSRQSRAQLYFGHNHSSGDSPVFVGVKMDVAVALVTEHNIMFIFKLVPQ